MLEQDVRRSGSWPTRLLEGLSALILVAVIVLLLFSVLSRYVFSIPIVWIDEAVSLLFLWLSMLGGVIASQRDEHLRLTLFVNALSQRRRQFVEAFALLASAVFLVGLIAPSLRYVMEEWWITSPALNIPNSFRVSAIAAGILMMLWVIGARLLKITRRSDVWAAGGLVLLLSGACWLFGPQLRDSTALSILVFLVGLVGVGIAAGVPIGISFGLGALTYLTFATEMPLLVIVGRMDEGMSALVLVSVPIFVLLGCVLDVTGMGRAIVDFLSSLLGHVRAGMSYVLLGSLFIVSGISGSKVSDMATVAPALFPEMKRRGNKPPEMIALLSTGAAMADTVPPSIVLIVLGSVAGISIAGLFQSGVVVAGVLLIALLLLARWKARNERVGEVGRAPLGLACRLMLVAAPALVLPFLIRSAVGGGVATATEVSTIAVIYALLIGKVLYGGISGRQFYTMLVDTAALSGAILIILGTASAMAWAITQSGVVQQLSMLLTGMPGGWLGFIFVSAAIFVLLGCLLEGLPAILLAAPIMFPIARQFGIHDIHYAMVMVAAMNIGLMMPPIGVGFFIACRIGNVSPDEAIGAIWPYIAALLAGLAVVAAIPAISTAVL